MNNANSQPIEVYILSEGDLIFEPISIDQNHLNEKLSSFDILLFIDPNNSIAWVRKGRDTSLRMRLSAEFRAKSLLKQKSLEMELKIIEEAEEPNAFWFMMGYTEADLNGTD